MSDAARTLEPPKSLLDTTANERRIMTTKETEIFMMLTMAEMHGQSLSILPQITESFPFQVLKKRLDYHKIKASEHATALAAIVLANGNPGNCVMWAYTFGKIYKQSGRPVTIQELANYFPTGFPTEEGYRRIWEEQKVDSAQFGTDNALDTDLVW